MKVGEALGLPYTKEKNSTMCADCPFDLNTRITSYDRESIQVCSSQNFNFESPADINKLNCDIFLFLRNYMRAVVVTLGYAVMTGLTL